MLDLSLMGLALNRRQCFCYSKMFSTSGNNSVVECDLAKVEVAGSNPVSRSNFNFAHVGPLSHSPRALRARAAAPRRFPPALAGGRRRSFRERA